MKTTILQLVSVLALTAAALLASGVADTAAQALAPPRVIKKKPPVRTGQLVKTCPDMAHAFGVPSTDGGTIRGPQGWFFEAALQDRPNGQTIVICRYGRQSRADLRAGSYAYDVEYVITDFKADQCWADGANVSCRK